MYQMHAGEQVGRGNTSSVSNTLSPVININVSGGASQDTIDQIARRLNQELSTFSRW